MLSKEEKKAIEILKTNPKTILDLISLDEKLLDKLSETENYSVEEIKEWAYKIILNLITKLQEENKVFKSALDKETADRSNDLLELQKKDKMINLMSEYMFNKNKAQLIIEYGIENKEQLIKEFEKQAKEKGE